MFFKRSLVAFSRRSSTTQLGAAAAESDEAVSLAAMTVSFAETEDSVWETLSARAFKNGKLWQNEQQHSQ